MRRIIKYWAVPISIFLFLLIFTLSLLPTLVNLEKYSSVVENRLSSITGREVKLGTDMTISFFPWFGLSVSDVVIDNPSGFDSNYFAKFKTFEARLKLFPLLVGKLSFHRFVIDGLELNLEKSKEGNINWNFLKGNGGSDSASGAVESVSWLFSTSLSLFAVTDGTIHYRNFVAESQHEIRELMLVISSDKNRGMTTIDGKGVLDGNHLTAEGIFTPVVNDGRYSLDNIELDFTVIDDLKVHLTGSLKDVFTASRYDLKITLPEFSPETLLSTARSPFLFANKGLTGIRDLAISGAVKGDLKRLIVEDGFASFDNSKAKFSAVYSKEETSKLQFVAEVDFIQLNDYLPERSFQAIGQGESEANNNSLTKRRKSIPGTNISGSLAFQELKLGALSLKDGHASIASDDGIKFQCDPVTFKLYGGSITSELFIDNSAEKSKSSVAIQAEKVDLESFAHNYLGFPVISGELAGTVRLNLSGSDVEGLLGELTGQGLLRFQEGEIRGEGLAQIVSLGAEKMSENDLDRGNRVLEYSEIISEITINTGLLETGKSTLKMESQDIALAGTMNLKTKDFSLQFNGQQPRPGKVATGTDKVDKQVMISGSLLEPKQIQISNRNSTANFSNSPNAIDVKTLVDEKIPSPQDDDVKNLEGKALIDPKIVAQRFKLQPEPILQQKKGKPLPQRSVKIKIHPLVEETSF